MKSVVSGLTRKQILHVILIRQALEGQAKSLNIFRLQSLWSLPGSLEASNPKDEFPQFKDPSKPQIQAAFPDLKQTNIKKKQKHNKTNWKHKFKNS